MKDAIIIGTRPEIIKCAPIIKFYEKKSFPLVLIHTNQHYSFNMDEIFFEEMQLRKPDHNLNVGSGTHAVQTGKIMAGIEKLLENERIDRILVQGDTNTVFGSAVAAAKMHVKIGHVEAGLRSYDREMPEEINRVLTDHISDYLFCPTTSSRDNGLKEGIPEEKTHVVGNTIVDATLQNYDIAKARKSEILAKYNVKEEGFNLLTAHRPANVDDKAKLQEILGIFDLIIQETALPIIFPVHPRTLNNLKKFGLEGHLPEKLQLIDPVGYLDFLVLEKNAKFIFTDSGGIQEEACVFHKPCITLRENTERPETVDAGANLIVGYDKTKIKDAIAHFINKKMEYEIPFGKGDASEKIFEILMHE